MLFATTANGVDAPVTLEISCEQATLFVRGDLTISWLDGRTEVVAEPRAAGGGRAYWGASHQRLIADFYDRLGDAGKTRAVFDEALADFQRIGGRTRADGAARGRGRVRREPAVAGH